MIDVDTYRMLPKAHQREIDLWLNAWLHPHHDRCAEIEMVDESGACRVRHLRIGADGMPVVNGDELEFVDRVVTGLPNPLAVTAFGPGSEPPPVKWVVEWNRSAAMKTKRGDET